MALISMATYCTPTNGRAPLLKQTLDSLLETVDFSRHRIFVIVNQATEESTEYLLAFQKALPFPDSLDSIIWLPENIGTARAINKAWALRRPGEHAIKMDDDVVVHRSGWVEEMEESIERANRIGIIGLKRKDLLESPNRPSGDPFRSMLAEVPHTAGQKNLYIEIVEHVMGTCQMYNAALLNKIGYLYQPSLYGFDDSLAATRCQKAGYMSCFLCGVEIDHIDPGGNAYTAEKAESVGRGTMPNDEYHRIKDAIESGRMGVYFDADGNNVVEHATPGYQFSTVNYSTR